MDHVLSIDLPTQGLPRFDDLKLKQRVAEALRATGYRSMRNIDVAVSGGMVILQGRVRSFYLKQVAQAAAHSVRGVCELCNELDVA
jgi:osmotically-inducible protein OsmY